MPGHTARITLNYKLRLPPGHFGVFVHRDPQMKRGVPIWTRIIDLHWQEEVRVLSHNEGKEEPGRPTAVPLASPLFHCNCEWTSAAPPK